MALFMYGWNENFLFRPIHPAIFSPWIWLSIPAQGTTRTVENIFFPAIANHRVNISPLAVVVMQTTHQMPSTPRPNPTSRIAKGIRRVLNTILVMAGGRVRPTP